MQESVLLHSCTLHAHDCYFRRIHDPYELFLTDICDSCPVNLIVEKVPVTHHKQSLLRRHAGRFAPGAGTRHIQDEDAVFFYRLVYTTSEMSHLKIPNAASSITSRTAHSYLPQMTIKTLYLVPLQTVASFALRQAPRTWRVLHKAYGVGKALPFTASLITSTIL